MENTLFVSLGDRIKHIIGLLFSSKKMAYITMGTSLLTLLIIILIVGFFSQKPKEQSLVTSQTPQNTSDSNSFTSQVRKSQKETSLALVLTNPKKEIHVNDTIMFQLVGDSNGQAIRGIDAAFRFDSDRVSYITVKNLFPSFDFLHRRRGAWVIITGEQPLTATSVISLRKKSLTEYQFKAKKAGIAYFPLSFVYGRLSDSNMISDTSTDILTKVDGLSVKILP